jgi:hypothetical protein
MTQRTILSAALVVLGVYVAAQSFVQAVEWTRILLEQALSSGDVTSVLLMALPGLASLAPPALLGALLIVRGHRLAAAVIRVDQPLGPARPLGWESTALWLGLALVGLFLFIDSVIAGVSITMEALFPRAEPPSEAMRVVYGGSSPQTGSYFVRFVCKLVIGLYFLAGAPHLRRFVLRRMLRQGVMAPPDAPAAGDSPLPPLSAASNNHGADAEHNGTSGV